MKWPGDAPGVNLEKEATVEKPGVKSNSWSQYLSCEEHSTYDQSNFDTNDGADDIVTAID